AFACACAAAAAAAPGDAWPDWDAFHADVAGWRLDSTRTARVASVLLVRDAATFALEDGRVALARELGGRRCALVFEGRGTFAFAPPSAIERAQLQRFFGAPALRRPFASLALVFTDSTLDELAPALAFAPDTLGALARVWRETLPYLTVHDTRLVRPLAVAQALLDREPGMLWAAFWRPHADPLFLLLDPFATERVQLQRTPEDEHYGLVRRYASETVCQFRAAGDTAGAGDDRPPYTTTHAAIALSLNGDLDADAVATLDVTALGRPRRWLRFDLHPTLRVDSVAAAGRAAGFWQDRDGPALWVRLEPPLAPGDTLALRVRYHGTLFTREGDRIFNDATTTWYPATWLPGGPTWDLSFRWPAPYQLVASGERLASATDGRTNTARWRVARPLPWASFDVDFLRGLAVPADSVPALVVWRRDVGGAGELASATPAGLAGDHSDLGRETRDVERALRFYCDAFGPPPVPALHAVETPQVRDSDAVWRLRYEAYPGLVHMMTPEDKVLPGVEFTRDFVRAHELAHQWWGLGVRPASYHDQWLAEGFADFCALWYLQAGRQDTKSYFEGLDRWRQQLFDVRRYPLGSGQPAGPIWLGTRTNSTATPGDYSVIVYRKGAWVLHMLRDVLLDLAHPDEAQFRAVLRAFYARHAGGEASTADFERTAEQVTGRDLDWFFREWVYGTDVPTYRFSSTIAPAAGNAWVVRGRVQSANVPDSFRMPVIVRVDFPGGRFARERVWVSGPVTEFELPPAPEKPVDVVFNDLHSVLCELAK
ncbi:MAG TPA: M1 family aminopeptidase, partial [Candidatus Eisenbacteria bacterium]|nr:M1 family aminopeptidase [Candidatus Eisenbacteria bacterium]